MTTMKTRLSLLLTSLLFTSAAAAQSHGMHAWTSNDQKTIHARFIGVGAGSVLIEKDGTVFHVPFSRLSTESVALARQLGGMAAVSDQSAAAVPTKPVVTLVAKTPPPVVLAKPVIHRPQMPPAPKPAVNAVPCTLALSGKTATATAEVPYTVQRAIEAGNFLQTKPYVWGGGHGSVIDRGYDCSGSVSYVLIQAGLLGRPLTSSGFARYGLPGPGKFISIYAGPGHVFMTVCGLRLDTGGRGGRGESGPRWSTSARYGSQWTVRHPPGW